MTKIGELVIINQDGENIGGAPSKFLAGMGLSHLEPAMEYLMTDDVCIVIGTSDYYGHRILALVSKFDGKVYVAYERNTTKVKQIKEVNYEEALDAWEHAKNNFIERMLYELIEDGELDIYDGNFDYEEWYEVAEEIAYNDEHLLGLRIFIENHHREE